MSGAGAQFGVSVRSCGHGVDVCFHVVSMFVSMQCRCLFPCGVDVLKLIFKDIGLGAARILNVFQSCLIYF